MGAIETKGPSWGGASCDIPCECPKWGPLVPSKELCTRRRHMAQQAARRSPPARVATWRERFTRRQWAKPRPTRRAGPGGALPAGSAECHRTVEAAEPAAANARARQRPPGRPRGRRARPLGSQAGWQLTRP
eukprot:scaffold517_cov392-Prasinococcus_capsulatus_cf.AAC.13